MTVPSIALLCSALLCLFLSSTATSILIHFQHSARTGDNYHSQFISPSLPSSFLSLFYLAFPLHLHLHLRFCLPIHPQSRQLESSSIIIFRISSRLALCVIPPSCSQQQQQQQQHDDATTINPSIQASPTDRYKTTNIRSIQSIVELSRSLSLPSPSTRILLCTHHSQLRPSTDLTSISIDQH